MFDNGMNAFTRREFIGRGLMLTSAAASVPAFVGSSASAMLAQLGGLSSAPGVPGDRVLVVIQLGGGNDGLNTVVPYGIDRYHKARPQIAVSANDALRLSGADGIGLHPQMGPMREMYDEGLVGIVQGVGYPNPNRSHFQSMDIWHTADTSGTGDGWLGRYFDSECCGTGKGESGRPESPQNGAGGPPGIAIGRTAPLAMQGRAIKPVSFESEELFRWIGQDVHESLREPYEKINRAGVPADVPPDSTAAFLLRTSLDAQVSSDMIRKAVAARPMVQYPQSDLARQLSMVGAMIRAGLRTRVFYVNHGGFDTHAGQGGAQGRHGNLLNQFAAAVKAFYDDLRAQQNHSRVLTLAFSEFGRRVSQNASGGTDHGTAAPSFVFGPMVKGGVHGDHPSLADLDEGDLKYLVDFRSVYASILTDWMKADARAVLGGTFRPMGVIKA